MNFSHIWLGVAAGFGQQTKQKEGMEKKTTTSTTTTTIHINEMKSQREFNNTLVLSQMFNFVLNLLCFWGLYLRTHSNSLIWNEARRTWPMGDYFPKKRSEKRKKKKQSVKHSLANC